MKELCRDGKGRGLSELVKWARRMQLYALCMAVYMPDSTLCLSTSAREVILNYYIEVSRSPKVGLPISGNLGVRKSHVKYRVK